MENDAAFAALIGEDRMRTLAAAVNRLIPEDEWPGGWEGGTRAYFAAPTALRDLGWATDDLRLLCDRLELAAERRYSTGFVTLPVAHQDAVLRSTGDDPSSSELIDLLVRLSREGFYAMSPAHSPSGIEMVGFRAVPEGASPREAAPLPSVEAEQVRRRYDAIIVGTGPGGGAAAQVLTAAGKSVLLVERAPALTNSQLRGDHIHGKRNGLYWPTVGPGPGYPRRVTAGGDDSVVDGVDEVTRYGLNAFVLGGGTRIWQGMSWRFFPEDFAMKSHYGNPEGASLADWPIDYAELEPYYSRAEWQLGVAGEVGPLTERTPRSAGYPMPAMGSEPARALLGEAADRLGWGWGPIPLAINSVPNDGRPACVRCPQCVGHACPVDAKNGSQNTFVARAIATGLCELLQDAVVTRVRDGQSVAGASIVANASTDPTRIEVEAAVIIVAAGAIETPRLIMASGLGNDQVGRNLHGHRFATVVGTVDEPVKSFRGPGHSIATLEHVHASTIPWGGGALVDLMELLPLSATAMSDNFGIPRWGAEHKEWMRDGRPHVFGAFGIGQEIPMPTSRVTLAAGLTDRFGMPGAALARDVHDASLEIERGMSRMAELWLAEAGLRQIRPLNGPPTASAAGEHSCGTMRMGSSDEDSATDQLGRVRGTHRIRVCDSSLLPTNGSVNPTLTIIANALRVAEHVAGSL